MERLTIRARLWRALHAARRELRAPAPPIWRLVDPRAANERFAGRVVDLAHDLVLDGIRVNAVASAHVFDRREAADRRAKVPFGLGGGAVPVEAVVHEVHFLADVETSPMTTGQQLIVSGAPDLGGLNGRAGR